ncbi:sulfite exporter TauE/SafE family protein [Chengkuizengella axinellae]|uniref:Probable membrane transporter protein n=1 Tax=Chengkuizengella axinellae TaxID=3064388 RepID=A0ABT9J1B3_9BACL|nr:sulfite exporter TauE/SafE family protein [Chengkuizengella sp. 2205SS18-9]MDP5275406.1 sulfite exporter TauE/SafE family protein [Chengkuizengella sp. 2205SS18-9]
MSDLTILQLCLTVLAAILIGFSKTGIPSAGIFFVVIFASTFPAKESIGILLPMLIAADIVAVTYYRRTVVWKYLFKLIPWVLGGMLLGFLVLIPIENEELSLLLGIIILTLIILHISKNKLESWLQSKFTESSIFLNILGVLAGFTTMVGNAAGAIMAIYLLTKGLKKNEFIGTGAWFFISVNLIKVPFFAYIGLITPATLVFNAWMIPAILIGTWLGIKLLPRIPQKHFQTIILSLSAVGGIKLIFDGVVYLS